MQRAVVRRMKGSARRSFGPWLAFVVCWLFFVIAAFSTRATAETCTKCASYEVKIQIVNGVVRVADPAGAQILHKEFLPAKPRLPNEEALKKILARDLDAALKNMSPLYWYALNGTDQKAGAQSDAFQKTLPACLHGNYKHSDWDKFTKCYDDARSEFGKPPHGFRELRVAMTGLESSLVGGGRSKTPRSIRPPITRQVN